MKKYPMKKSKALGFEMYTADPRNFKKGHARINLETVIFTILIIGLIVSFVLIIKKTAELSNYMMELEYESDTYDMEKVMDALAEQRGVHPETKAEMPPYWGEDY